MVYWEGSEEALILKGVQYNLKWKEKISIKTTDDNLYHLSETKVGFCVSIHHD